MMEQPAFFGDTLFKFVPIFIGIIFVIVFGVILLAIVSAIRQWRKNEQSPRLSVPAIIKAKRTNTRVGSHSHGADNQISHHSHTSYYVTFEFESTDRLEFTISGSEYGMLAEGDFGVLTFQGTRFLGFERK